MVSSNDIFLGFLAGFFQVGFGFIFITIGARVAVNYNLDLSYRRARSIFRYAFDTSQIKFDYQPDLMRYVKITGRGYLTSAADTAITDRATLSKEEFCARYDCREEQAVLIRFTLLDGSPS